MSDAELVQRVLSGDSDAGNEFVDRCEKLIYSVLVRQCGIPTDHQEDAYQYVFVKLFEDDCRRLRLWRGESALSSFLFVVVRNLGRDYREKEFRKDKWEMPDEDCPENGASDGTYPTPEDETIINRMGKVVRDLVESLEDICRKIIDLRFMEDLSYKEIALKAGITVSNVGVRLHRCLDSLALLMRREFPDLFEDRFNLDL
ncbi:MAG: RNA polymerase sigma factor [bacterium]|nr:RNA polymerase sigma factor [bacterium]